MATPSARFYATVRDYTFYTWGLHYNLTKFQFQKDAKVKRFWCSNRGQSTQFSGDLCSHTWRFFFVFYFTKNIKSQRVFFVMSFDRNFTSKLWLRQSSRDWEHAVKFPCCRCICAISRWASAWEGHWSRQCWRLPWAASVSPGKEAKGHSWSS